MDWFRSYHGAPYDPKWRVIAKQLGCHAGEVAVTFWALLDAASQSRERGVTHCDAADRHRRIEEISAGFDMEFDVVQSIYSALEDRQVVKDGKISAWEKRQPKREDSSTERTRKYRERTVTQRDAPVTQRDDRTEQSRTEKKNSPKVNLRSASRRRGTRTRRNFSGPASDGWQSKTGRARISTARSSENGSGTTGKRTRSRRSLKQGITRLPATWSPTSHGF